VPLPVQPGPRDIVVNVRRGIDYGMKDWTLSLSYYDRVLAAAKDLGRVYVCGTCVDADVRRVLGRYDPVYIEGAPIEHFALMTHSRRLVLSNSTFAWWAAFLSDATEIHAPRSVDGEAYAFTGVQDVDLHMRAPRYIEVADAKLALFAPFEANRTRIGDAHAAVDADTRALLTWMAGENRRIPLAEIRARYQTLDVNKTFGALVRAGLVRAETSYVEDGVA
jgi:hypothetical protein